jgi:hypothetical protein
MISVFMSGYFLEYLTENLKLVEMVKKMKYDGDNNKIWGKKVHKTLTLKKIPKCTGNGKRLVKFHISWGYQMP